MACWVCNLTDLVIFTGSEKSAGNADIDPTELLNLLKAVLILFNPCSNKLIALSNFAKSFICLTNSVSPVFLGTSTLIKVSILVLSLSKSILEFKSSILLYLISPIAFTLLAYALIIVTILLKFSILILLIGFLANSIIFSVGIEGIDLNIFIFEVVLRVDIEFTPSTYALIIVTILLKLSILILLIGFLANFIILSVGIEGVNWSLSIFGTKVVLRVDIKFTPSTYVLIIETLS